MTNDQYTFTYYGFIPSYKDFDQDWFTINALSIEDAWSKVRRMKLFLKSEVTLDCINGKKVDPSLRAMPVVVEQTTPHEEKSSDQPETNAETREEDVVAVLPEL
jgi:hypothetical protein